MILALLLIHNKQIMLNCSINRLIKSTFVQCKLQINAKLINKIILLMATKKSIEIEQTKFMKIIFSNIR